MTSKTEPKPVGLALVKPARPSLPSTPEEWAEFVRAGRESHGLSAELSASSGHLVASILLSAENPVAARRLRVIAEATSGEPNTVATAA